MGDPGHCNRCKDLNVVRVISNLCIFMPAPSLVAGTRPEVAEATNSL